MTCWRPLRDWQAAGVFDALLQVQLAECHDAGLANIDRLIADASHIRAKGALRPGPAWSTGQDRFQASPADLQQRPAVGGRV